MILCLSPNYVVAISPLQWLQQLWRMDCVRRAVEVSLTEGKQTADRGISRLIARIKKRRTGATTRRGNKCKKTFSLVNVSCRNFANLVEI